MSQHGVSQHGVSQHGVSQQTGRPLGCLDMIGVSRHDRGELKWSWLMYMI